MPLYSSANYTLPAPDLFASPSSANPPACVSQATRLAFRSQVHEQVAQQRCPRRITPAAYRRFTGWLRDRDLKGSTQQESNEAQRVRKHFALNRHGRLISHLAAKKRYVLKTTRIARTVAKVHARLGHSATAHQVWSKMFEKYHGVNKKDVEWLVDRCLYKGMDMGHAGTAAGQQNQGTTGGMATAAATTSSARVASTSSAPVTSTSGVPAAVSGAATQTSGGLVPGTATTTGATSTTGTATTRGTTRTRATATTASSATSTATTSTPATTTTSTPSTTSATGMSTTAAAATSRTSRTSRHPEQEMRLSEQSGPARTLHEENEQATPICRHEVLVAHVSIERKRSHPHHAAARPVSVLLSQAAQGSSQAASGSGNRTTGGRA